jgi:hypothetical protein
MQSEQAYSANGAEYGATPRLKEILVVGIPVALRGRSGDGVTQVLLVTTEKPEIPGVEIFLHRDHIVAGLALRDSTAKH